MRCVSSESYGRSVHIFIQKSYDIQFTQQYYNNNLKLFV